MEIFLKYQRKYVAFYDNRLHWDKLDILDELRVTKERVRENYFFWKNALDQWANGFAFYGMWVSISLEALSSYDHKSAIQLY